jgi:DNA repair protein RecN (Recombination protein N)
MLSRLYLKDFAIATAVDFDLQEALGVISGETGAGKSLLVDALLLLSGSRADPSVVRHGAERAELGAEFLLDANSPAMAWLAERELDDGSRCLLRRVIRADGGSRAWINGSPSTIGQLGELAAMLVEIHGQHEHQALLDRGQQLRLVDDFGAHADLLAAVQNTHRAWRTLVDERESLTSAGDPAQRIDYLRHQLSQLSSRNLDPAHITELSARHRRLAAAQQIADALGSAQRQLAEDGTGGARGALRGARNALERVQEHLPALADTVSMLDSAAIQLDEAAIQLERCAGDLELDADSAEAVDAELSDLHEMGRRHRAPMEELGAIRDRLSLELEALVSVDSRREQLDRAIAAAAGTWSTAAQALSKARAKAAAQLGSEVSALMEELGMVGGRLVAELTAQPGADPHPAGAERVELCVSANAGQPPRPLRKVASGGELSRISLAIEVATFGGDGIPTMVFDEVDSGIGGAVAEVVGLKLRALAAHRQVLCVTHLPQVAAQGHYQFRVSKRIEDGVTRSRLERLDQAGRVEELARMLGGLEITDTTLAHARQMLQQAAANP